MLNLGRNLKRILADAPRLMSTTSSRRGRGYSAGSRGGGAWELSQHPPNRLKEIIDDGVRFYIGGGQQSLAGPVASLYQDPPRHRRAGQRDIGPSIPDHDRAREVEVKLPSGPGHHAGLRFLTRAGAAIRRDGGVDQMRAIVVTIQPLSHGVQAPLDFIPRRQHHGFRHHTPGDTRLVRDDNHRVSDPAQEANGFDTVGIHLQTLEAVNISHVLDEGTVPVEEYGCG